MILSIDIAIFDPEHLQTTLLLEASEPNTNKDHSLNSPTQAGSSSDNFGFALLIMLHVTFNALNHLRDKDDPGSLRFVFLRRHGHVLFRHVDTWLIIFIA